MELLVSFVLLSFAGTAILDGWLGSYFTSPLVKRLKKEASKLHKKGQRFSLALLWRKLLSCRFCLTFHVGTWSTLAWGAYSSWSVGYFILMTPAVIGGISLLDTIIPERSDDGFREESDILRPSADEDDRLNGGAYAGDPGTERDSSSVHLG